ncbi:WapI family immunity protein [Spirosoma lituiforme]
MKFVSSANSLDSFEFAILGYGQTTQSWRDRNRLQCRFSTLWKQQADIQSARLHTWEVKRLLTGLRSLWNKATNQVALTFSEPGLSMHARALSDDSYRLQIQLGHNLTPSWHAYPDFPVEMDIVMSRKQLQEAIKDLSGQIETYPER